MLTKCPRCQSRYSHDPFNTDFVHSCGNAGSALRLESIKVIGTWDDYTGSAVVNDNITSVAGAANALQWTDAGLAGADLESTNPHGKRKSVYRTRQRLEYIDLTKQD